MNRIWLIVPIFTLAVLGSITNISAETYASVEAAMRAAGTEFAAIVIGQSANRLPEKSFIQDDLVAGPGVRISYYAKSYGDNEYDYAFVTVEIVKGNLAFKLTQIVQINKTHCMNTTVKTVEYMTSLGVRNWKKYWREDYQVAHWKAIDGGYRFSVTCRYREGVWWLEESRGLASVAP